MNYNLEALAHLYELYSTTHRNSNETHALTHLETIYHTQLATKLTVNHLPLIPQIWVQFVFPFLSPIELARLDRVCLDFRALVHSPLSLFPF